MLGFNKPPKRVTEQELEIVQKKLHMLDKEERADVEQLFRGDLHELRDVDKGIDQTEFDAGIAWLRGNPHKHSLEDDDIDKVERYYGEHLND